MPGLRLFISQIINPAPAYKQGCIVTRYINRYRNKREGVDEEISMENWRFHGITRKNRRKMDNGREGRRKNIRRKGRMLRRRRNN